MRSGLLPLLFLSLLLVPIGANLVPSAQSYPNTWVIAFYPGSYPSGTSEQDYSSFTVNFSSPFPATYNATSYAGFVETVTMNSNIGNLAIQLILEFEGPGVVDSYWGTQNGYDVLAIQIWAPGRLLYQQSMLVPMSFIGNMTLEALPNNPTYAAVGILKYSYGPTYEIYVPRTFNSPIGNVTFDNTDFGGGVNPSFALEGTAYNIFYLFLDIQPIQTTGWDGMYINGEWVQNINAVAGNSPATGVGGTAPLPSSLAETGLTLFHYECCGIWWGPYAWYFSIGWVFTYEYMIHNITYIQLAEGQTYNTINGLNYATQYFSE